MNIGIVDDIDIVRVMFNRIFERFDDITITTYDCAEAVKTSIKKDNLDLLLVDYNMAVENGSELVQHLCLLDIDTKFCYVTCHPKENLFFDNENVIGYIEKPITLDALNNFIYDFKKKYNTEKGAKNRFLGKKGYYEKELKKWEDLKNSNITHLLGNVISEADYKKWIKDEYEVNKKQIELKLRGVDGEISNYTYVDKIESWMDLMKEELLNDYNIERKEDKKRILDKYIEKVFVKEVINEEGKKKFEVRIGLRIGKQKGDVVYDLNKKRLSLKEKDNHFYILNNDFVLGCDLIYKKHLVVRITYQIEWSLCGREKLEFDKKSLQITDYQWIS